MENIGIYLISAISAGSAVIFEKQYITTQHNIVYMLLAIIMYAILLYSYYILFQSHALGITYVTLKIMSMMLVTMVSIFYYKEKMSKYQVLGFLLGICAVYLLALKDDSLIADFK